MCEISKPHGFAANYDNCTWSRSSYLLILMMKEIQISDRRLAKRQISINMYSRTEGLINTNTDPDVCRVSPDQNTVVTAGRRPGPGRRSDEQKYKHTYGQWDTQTY
ncbi:jg8339 [Pararge aegeria aegeria]|uniref:Jg8339 protein n=1 Tax=Pararge aegeria aegeria TaxID=348720 RepID=A0A8S4SMF3_9NEOP|nr:jg8339 [Pararge aegeria aegeria]